MGSRRAVTESPGPARRRVPGDRSCLEDRSLRVMIEAQDAERDPAGRILRLLRYLSRVRDLEPPCSVLVIGCGPHPAALRVLRDIGHHAVGIDVSPSFVEAARAYLPQPEWVRAGDAQALPVGSGTQDLVLCESVLEHVESARRCLEELHRVLRPDGLAYVATTNRHRVSITGRNGEFNIRFFQWFPPLLREAYIHHHLHHDPSLANFSPRPAVHWFTFAELCRLGRDAGFARFYSLLDVLRKDDDVVRRSRLRRRVLPHLQRSPLLRALALTQLGHAVVMWKRDGEG